jgi:hypothetical protein
MSEERRRDGTADAAADTRRLLREGLEDAAPAPVMQDRRLALMFSCAHHLVVKGFKPSPITDGLESAPVTTARRRSGAVGPGNGLPDSSPAPTGGF